MMRKGIIQMMNGLYGYVDAATQGEEERITGEATIGSGLIVYIPLMGLTQKDINDTVEPRREVMMARKHANK